MEVKINKDFVEDILALSSMQQGILFQYIADDRKENYFEQLSLTIKGQLNWDIFIRSWEFVIENNEMLRTIFSWKKTKTPVQIVLKKQEKYFKYYDLSQETEEKKMLVLKKIKEQDIGERFDLETGPLFRVRLCKLDNQLYEMIISNHHIIYDGWSNGLILREFFETYRNYLNNQPIKKLKKTGFKEYLYYCQRRDKSNEKKYWAEYLQGFTEKNLFFTENKEGTFDTKGYLEEKISAELTAKIRHFIKDYGLTLSSLIYTAWGLLLQFYTNASDVVTGITLSGRPPEIVGIENMVGLFINTIPLRIKASGKEKLIDLINRVKKDVSNHHKYQLTPLVDIKSNSELKPGENLFDTIVVVENYPLSEVLTDLTTNIEICGFSMHEKTEYDMVLEVQEFSDLLLKLSYKSQCFSEKYMKQLVNHLLKLVELIVNNPNIQLENVEIVDLKEKEKILNSLNGTINNCIINTHICELFENCVKKNGDAIALVFMDQSLTYNELNERACSLAKYLVNKGVGPETIIGIMMEPSLERIIAILGILKAGAAYLPIEPDYPVERIEYMLKESGAPILITRSKWKNQFIFPGLIIGFDHPEEFKGFKESLRVSIKPDNLAYVIYTSGSTGRPKGVMVEHHSLVNLSLWHSKFLGLKKGVRAIQYTSIGFDVSVGEIFPILISGGELHIIPEEMRLDLAQLNEYLEKNKIEVCFFPTAIGEKFLQYKNSSLKKIIVGGEKLRTFIPGDYDLINIYGPTEATVYVTYFTVDRDYANIPIGKPIDNTKVYILDRYKRLQPIGVPGELWISGEGLARGYIKNPELTGERFIENSFEKGQRMYKTGDLARWVEDGNLEFLGRLDRQVKIRGYRIELEEIEKNLLKIEGVKEVVVTIKENLTGNKNLVAYVVLENDVDFSDIKKDLAKKLPSYMIPNHFVRLDKIPLSFSGKVDYSSLPEKVLEQGLNHYIPPRNKLEEQLVEIWKQILGVKEVGIDDSFFELGGNSINIITLYEKIKTLTGLEFKIADLFSYHTIAMFSGYIQAKSKQTNIPDDLNQILEDLFLQLKKREITPEKAADIFMHLKSQG